MSCLSTQTIFRMRKIVRSSLSTRLKCKHLCKASSILSSSMPPALKGRHFIAFQVQKTILCVEPPSNVWAVFFLDLFEDFGLQRPIGSGYIYVFDHSSWDILIYYLGIIVRVIEAWCIRSMEGSRNVRIGVREVDTRVLFEKDVECSYERQLGGLAWNWLTIVVSALGINLKSDLPVALTVLCGVFQISRATCAVNVAYHASDGVNSLSEFLQPTIPSYHKSWNRACICCWCS